MSIGPLNGPFRESIAIMNRASVRGRIIDDNIGGGVRCRFLEPVGFDSSPKASLENASERGDLGLSASELGMLGGRGGFGGLVRPGLCIRRWLDDGVPLISKADAAGAADDAAGAGIEAGIDVEVGCKKPWLSSRRLTLGGIGGGLVVGLPTAVIPMTTKAKQHMKVMTTINPMPASRSCWCTFKSNKARAACCFVSSGFPAPSSLGAPSLAASLWRWSGTAASSWSCIPNCNREMSEYLRASSASHPTPVVSHSVSNSADSELKRQARHKRYNIIPGRETE
mmetsp:Transcript_8023/g.14723  ORF Transcript_8023/g.14723 Transcript_8023/m.14723 type:complete len:282 (-) Transcript_8023:166-1011(-)